MKNIADTNPRPEDGAGSPAAAAVAVESLLDGHSPAHPGEAPWRTLEYFASTRVIVGSALVLASAAGARPVSSAGGPQLTALTALLYFSSR